MHVLFKVLSIGLLSDTRNLLKIYFHMISRGVPYICRLTYLLPENSLIHAEEDMFQIIENDITLFRLNYSNHCLLLASDLNA